MGDVDWARTVIGLVPSGKSIQRMLRSKGLLHLIAAELCDDLAQENFSSENLFNCHYEPFGDIALRMLTTTLGVRLGIYSKDSVPEPTPN